MASAIRRLGACALAALFCVVLLLLVKPESAAAASCSAADATNGKFVLTVNPCNGQVRTFTTLSVSSNLTCQSLTLTWDGTVIDSSKGTSYQNTYQVPTDAIPGSHAIKAVCLIDPAANQTFTATVRFTVDPPSISLSPASGYAGYGFTITNHGWPVSCQQVSFWFDANLLATVSTPADGGGVAVQTQQSTPSGTHQVKGTCQPGNVAVPITVTSNIATYTVLTRKTSSAGSPTPSASTSVPTTVVTTSAPPTSSSATPSATPTHSTPHVTATPTHSAVPTPTADSSAPPPDHSLTLSTPEVQPGGGVSASGAGCAPRSPVHLSIDGNPVGDTTADDTGAFSTPLRFGSLPVGRYRVDAACGVVLAAPLDVVLVSEVSSATSTLTIIIFVLLVGLLIYRRRLVAHVLSRPGASAEPEEPAEP